MKFTDHALCLEALSHHSADASQTRALRQHSRNRRGEKAVPSLLLKYSGSLKTLVLSFLTCPNFSTFHYLNTRVEHFVLNLLVSM